MAKITGSAEKNGYGFYALLSETLGENYLNTNVSTVKFDVYIVNGNMRTNSTNWTFNSKIDGTNVYNKTSQTLVTNDTDYKAAKKLFSGSKAITHDSNGGKTITFSASLTKTSAYSSYDPGKCTLSGSFKLTNIPRASSISCPSGNIGEVVHIVVSKTVEEYTSTLTWECDNLSGTIATKTAEKTVPFTIPTSIYNLIPDETSKVVTIKCTTFNGDTQIGDTQSTTMTARVATDNNKPTLSYTLTETNQKVVNLLGSATTGTGVLNASVFKVIVSGSAKNGATIDRIVVTNGSKTVTGTGSEILMSKLESAVISVTIYDSRGISNTVTKDLAADNKIVNYYAPNVKGIKLTRENQTSSNVYLDLTSNFFNGNIASTKNTLTIKYKFKKVKETTWSSLKTVSYSEIIVDDEDNATVSLSNKLIESSCEFTSSYEFEFYIEDKLTSIEKKGLTVPQGIMTFGIGEKNVYLNGNLKLAKNDGTNRKDLFDWIYPVGSIVYLDVPTNPADLWGVGTWERIQGRFLLAGNDEYEQYAPGAIGGAVTKTTSGHTHSLSSGYALINMSASSNGIFAQINTKVTSWKDNYKHTVSGRASSSTDNTRATKLAGNTGSKTDTVDVMPPYYAVYVWKRIS